MSSKTDKINESINESVQRTEEHEKNIKEQIKTIDEFVKSGSEYLRFLANDTSEDHSMETSVLGAALEKAKQMKEVKERALYADSEVKEAKREAKEAAEKEDKAAYYKQTGKVRKPGLLQRIKSVFSFFGNLLNKAAKAAASFVERGSERRVMGSSENVNMDEVRETAEEAAREAAEIKERQEALSKDAAQYVFERADLSMEDKIYQAAALAVQEEIPFYVKSEKSVIALYPEGGRVKAGFYRDGEKAGEALLSGFKEGRVDFKSPEYKRGCGVLKREGFCGGNETYAVMTKEEAEAFEAEKGKQAETQTQQQTRPDEEHQQTQEPMQQQEAAYPQEPVQNFEYQQEPVQDYGYQEEDYGYQEQFSREQLAAMADEAARQEAELDREPYYEEIPADTYYENAGDAYQEMPQYDEPAAYQEMPQYDEPVAYQEYDGTAAYQNAAPKSSRPVILASFKETLLKEHPESTRFKKGDTTQDLFRGENGDILKDAVKSVLKEAKKNPGEKYPLTFGTVQYAFTYAESAKNPGRHEYFIESSAWAQTKRVDADYYSKKKDKIIDYPFEKNGGDPYCVWGQMVRKGVIEDPSPAAEMVRGGLNREGWRESMPKEALANVLYAGILQRMDDKARGTQTAEEYILKTLPAILDKDLEAASFAKTDEIRSTLADMAAADKSTALIIAEFLFGNEEKSGYTEALVTFLSEDERFEEIAEDTGYFYEGDVRRAVDSILKGRDVEQNTPEVLAGAINELYKTKDGTEILTFRMQDAEYAARNIEPGIVLYIENTDRWKDVSSVKAGEISYVAEDGSFLTNHGESVVSVYLDENGEISQSADIVYPADLKEMRPDLYEEVSGRGFANFKEPKERQPDTGYEIGE